MATVTLGNIKFNWKGAWNSGTAYVIDDVVSLSGSSYVSIQAGTNQNPASASAYWQQMSAAGTNGTDLTSTLTTQGDIVYRNSSGLARLGYGTAGQVLKTGGSGANPSWGTLSSDYVKLGSVSATGSASSITIDNLFTSDYDIYKIFYTRMNPASGIDHTQFRMRLLNASGSEITSSDYQSSYQYHYVNSGSNSVSSETQWNSDFVKLHRDHIGQRTDNYKSHDLEMTLYNPLSTSYKTGFHWNCNGDDGGGTSEYQNIGRGFTNASVIANRGIKFYTYDGDNIDANAKVTLYGIKN